MTEQVRVSGLSGPADPPVNRLSAAGPAEAVDLAVSRLSAAGPAEAVGLKAGPELPLALELELALERVVDRRHLLNRRWRY